VQSPAGNDAFAQRTSLGKVNLPWKALWAEAELADAQMAINPSATIEMMRVKLVFMVGAPS
jgi:hypothetical protein